MLKNKKIIKRNRFAVLFSQKKKKNYNSIILKSYENEKRNNNVNTHKENKINEFFYTNTKF